MSCDILLYLLTFTKYNYYVFKLLIKKLKCINHINYCQLYIKFNSYSLYRDFFFINQNIIKKNYYYYYKHNRCLK